MADQLSIMKRILIYCEGQTEETFVRDILQPYFNNLQIFLSAKNMNGGNTYGKIKKEITCLCKNDPTAYITSMIDLYGLPNDFPDLNKVKNTSNSIQKVTIAEDALRQDINQTNFVPNIILHEFEALLFSNLSRFDTFTDSENIKKLQNDVSGLNPEDINDSKPTAPSKRILRYFKNYRKPFHGSVIAQKIGLDIIRQKCPHFNGWLDTLINL